MTFSSAARQAGPVALDELRERIRASSRLEESLAIDTLLASLHARKPELAVATTRARTWVAALREGHGKRSFVDSMLERFPLHTSAGRALMGLAEALLRTPDDVRATQLISEKLAQLRESAPPAQRSAVLEAAVGLLGFASKILPDVPDELAGRRQLASLAKPLTAPVIRAAFRRSMRMLGQDFVFAESMSDALSRGQSLGSGSPCSFDMLGEGARTEADAERYFDSYLRAIEALRAQSPAGLHQRSGVSVKLSAIEPRYSLQHRSMVLQRLVPRAIELARAAAGVGVGLTIDAEEADRLDLSLDIIEAMARDESTRNWQGLGCAIQAYGLRAPLVIEWVAQLARETGRRMTVRLVKGAYWDSEIKRAQERGLGTFPVFTSKVATDVSYLACAQRLFAATDVIYPQFATHNAFTIAAVLGMAPRAAAFEFQRLHGMGESLYNIVRAEAPELPLVRVYAPVGTHEDLLPYLVRRLLENGANSSFVHQLLNRDIPVEQLVRDPITEINRLRHEATPVTLRRPDDLYAPARTNSRGVDLGNPDEVESLTGYLRTHSAQVSGGPIINGRVPRDLNVIVASPARTAHVVGLSRDATAEEIDEAMRAAAAAQPAWSATRADIRAAALDRAADLLEQRGSELMRLLVEEAGKTIPDAIGELREAVDFCRYYAARGRELFGAGERMPGPAGESNVLSLHGRGVFVCISPWNFPLAIFMGQITAALMAGNAVVAKPAPSTPLIAHVATRLLHEAGIPRDVLHLTPADGPAFGNVAFAHPALAGVVFTGSTATATTINRALASRDGAILPLIAETGGVNAMIVDATALPEQVVDDAITSAFTSAGQRCSALRVLYLQDEIADRVIEMLVGAMKCLVLGDPADIGTDVGPMISKDAVRRMHKHVERMSHEARIIYAGPLDSRHDGGHFFPPQLIELKSLDQLRTEEFGPILHVVRYKSRDLPAVLDAIRRTGFGLTLGLHSRLESMVDHVFRESAVGNTYVNRSMIGAVVGTQPFGGQGLSGTGPKAGGPNYLLRFATERTLTVNTAALGGNLELLA
jgi:RHH-type proline utilization regulon transcriptional repressor/proline dehydrogenase/delta 1-pyrroline-5-carboxylate dehydrogenase